MAIISLILNACKQNPQPNPVASEIKKKKIQIPEKTDSKIMDNDLKDEIDKGEKIEKQEMLDLSSKSKLTWNSKLPFTPIFFGMIIGGTS